MARKKLPTDVKDKIIEMHSQGMTPQEIARRLGGEGYNIKPTSIAKYIKNRIDYLYERRFQQLREEGKIYTGDRDIYEATKKMVLKLLNEETMNQHLNRYNYGTILTALLDFWARMASIEKTTENKVNVMNVGGSSIKIEVVDSNEQPSAPKRDSSSESIPSTDE